MDVAYLCVSEILGTPERVGGTFTEKTAVLRLHKSDNKQTSIASEHVSIGIPSWQNLRDGCFSFLEKRRCGVALTFRQFNNLNLTFLWRCVRKAE